MIYTGIGSRKNVPLFVKERAIYLGRFFASNKVVLRSGGADGMDKHFETGCDTNLPPGPKEIYRAKDILYTWTEEAARRQCWEFPFDEMKNWTKQLLQRSMYQVLGTDGNTPSKHLFYWCPGDPMIKSDTRSHESGGTRYAVRLAHEVGVSCWHLEKDWEKIKKGLGSSNLPIKPDYSIEVL